MEEEELNNFRIALKYALKSIMDPEMHVDIYELGLIRRIDIIDDKDIEIDFILTSPACPVAGEFPDMIKEAVKKVPGVGNVEVSLLTDVVWTEDMLREDARLELGIW